MITGRIAWCALATMLTAACGSQTGPRTDTRPADYVGVPLADARSGTPLDPDGARLIGAHYEVRFVSVQVTGYLMGSTAAPGHEFVILYQDLAEPPVRYPGGPPTATVVVDGVTRTLQHPPSYPGLMVSVPIGHDATLQIADEGRTQSLSMRTGKRGPDAQAAFYRPHQISWANAAYDASGQCRFKAGTLTTTAKVRFDGARASLQPWLPGLGWAKPGRIWAVFSGLDVTSGISVDDTAPYANDLRSGFAAVGFTFTVDRGETFTITADDTTGKPLPQNSPVYGSPSVTLVFDLADSFAGGTLTIHPPETVATGDVPPASVVWTKHLPTVAVPLVLR